MIFFLFKTTRIWQSSLFNSHVTLSLLSSYISTFIHMLASFSSLFFFCLFQLEGMVFEYIKWFYTLHGSQTASCHDFFSFFFGKMAWESKAPQLFFFHCRGKGCWCINIFILSIDPIFLKFISSSVPSADSKITFECCLFFFYKFAVVQRKLNLCFAFFLYSFPPFNRYLPYAIINNVR